MTAVRGPLTTVEQPVCRWAAGTRRTGIRWTVRDSTGRLVSQGTRWDPAPAVPAQRDGDDR